MRRICHRQTNTETKTKSNQKNSIKYQWEWETSQQQQQNLQSHPLNGNDEISCRILAFNKMPFDDDDDDDQTEENIFAIRIWNSTMKFFFWKRFEKWFLY